MIPVETAYDYELADALGLSVDAIRIARASSLAAIRRHLRRRGYHPPADNLELIDMVARLRSRWGRGSEQ